MKTSFLVAAVTLSIAASTLSSTAQDKTDYWSPPAKLLSFINSEYIKERPASPREEEGQNRCSQHHFGQFSDWSEPVWLGPIVNSNANDFHPISHNGLSLYISSNRTGGFGSNDIRVSQRASLDDPWGPPQNPASPASISIAFPARTRPASSIFMSAHSVKTAGSDVPRLSESSIVHTGIHAPPSGVTVWKCSLHPTAALADQVALICG
jgi:hypothetical protein